MAVNFRKQPIKFLQKARPEDLAKIQKRLNQLFVSIEEQGIIPFNDLDIERLKGEWEGFYRLRIGRIRAIFTTDLESADVECLCHWLQGRRLPIEDTVFTRGLFAKPSSGLNCSSETAIPLVCSTYPTSSVKLSSL